MAWRGIHLSQESRLSIEHGQLVIHLRESQRHQVPVEDIAYLIIDTPRAMISSAVLSLLAEAGVALLGTDAAHMPTWCCLPHSAHYKPGPALDLQLSATRPVRKRLWRRIIQAKISNQSRCLHAQHSDKAPVVAALVSQVLSGDSKNTEARAARVYWPAAFGVIDQLKLTH